MKLKIVEAGWKGYTGMFGVVEFVDGISVDHVNHVERNLLCSLIRVEEFDEGVVEQPQEEKVAEPQVESDAAQDSVATDAAPAAPGYSREKLEQIADEKGIAGLREIGDSWGVKATSIAKLIDEILEAQAK